VKSRYFEIDFNVIFLDHFSSLQIFCSVSCSQKLNSLLCGHLSDLLPIEWPFKSALRFFMPLHFLDHQHMDFKVNEYSHYIKFEVLKVSQWWLESTVSSDAVSQPD
jgi:hypothetical protein